MLEVLTLFVFNIVIYSIPLLYATCGEIMVEKSGSLNLGVEGTMAIGAVFGYIAGCRTDSFVVAVLVSFIVSALVGAVFCVFTITFQANQNVTGLTITTIGVAVYFFVGNALGTNWPYLRDCEGLVKGFSDIEIPLLSRIPFIGKAFFSHNIMVYFAVLLAVIIWLYFEKTSAGLRLRAIGENPGAADSLGVNIVRYKFIHIMIGSGIMGIGGLYMGLNMGGNFEGSNCWINGYGWIAIALVIFANWSTMHAVLGTFVFGFFNTLRVYNMPLATTFPKIFGWLSDVPAQFFSALPFIVTLLVLIVNSLRYRNNNGSNSPSAIGVNYYREDR